MAIINPPHMPQIDPRYQFMMTLCPAEGIAPPTKEYLPVIAKVSNLEEWRGHAQHAVAHLGSTVNCGENWIVTARVPFFQFPQLNNLPFVRRLEIATPLFLDLKDTAREIGLAGNPKIPKPVLDQGGENVIIGIVDEGCDFAHSHFVDSSKRTRIHSIWVQREKLKYREGKLRAIVSKDKRFTENDINRALRNTDPNKDPYDVLKYYPEGRSGEVLDHGTHVMDIAAGNGSNPGIAPRAKIIFVDHALKIEADTDFRGKTTFAKVTDSQRLIDAVQYIFDEAQKLNRPCVVNLSLGQHGGPHDGTTLVEEALDSMLEVPNRAIVISAGNSYYDRSHCSGTIPRGGYVDILWEIKQATRTLSENELEIWYSADDEFAVDIIYTDGTILIQCPLGKDAPIPLQGIPIGYVSHRRVDGSRKWDPKNSDHVLKIFHNPNANSDGGVWTLRVYGTRVRRGNFHAWIERGSNSSFLNADPNYTLNSIGTGRNTIVVGSYNARMPDTPISYFSSAGPTRDGRHKPDVSAPGHYVLAAYATSNNGVIEMSGTSMSAPVVTGLVARILGQAYQKKTPLNVNQIRQALITTCRKNPPAVQSWDSRYGFGRVYAGSILAFPSSIQPPTSVQPRTSFSATPPRNPPSPPFDLKPPPPNISPAAAINPDSIPEGFPCLMKPPNSSEDFLARNVAYEESKSPHLAYAVGLHYYHGVETAQNLIVAFTIFLDGANKGNSMAQYATAICCFYGHGTPANPQQALLWATKSQEPQAKELIGHIKKTLNIP